MIESPNPRADTTVRSGKRNLPNDRRLSKPSLPGEPDDHGPE